MFQWDILGRPLTLLALQTCAYALLAVTMDRSQRTGHPSLADAAGPVQRALQPYLEPLLPRLPLAMRRHASRWLGLKAVQGSPLVSWGHKTLTLCTMRLRKKAHLQWSTFFHKLAMPQQQLELV